MSDLYDLVVNHFGDLEPADYFVLAAAVVLVGFLLYRWLRTVYREPLEAQQAATAGWRETVEAHQASASGWRDVAEAYKVQIDGLREQSAQLERDIERVQQARHGREEVLISGATVLMITANQYSMLSALKSKLIIYMGMEIHAHFPESPAPIDLFREIGEIEATVDEIRDIASRDVTGRAFNVSAELLQTVELDPEGEIIAMSDKMDPHVERALNAGLQLEVGGRRLF